MIGRHSLGAAWRLVVAVLFCVSVILPASEAFAAAFVGQAVKVRGDVRLTRDGADVAVSMGTALQLGDVIKTGPGARLRLRFVDGSILALAENTTISIDLFAVDATNKSRTVVLTILDGIVNAAAAKSGESKFDYQIKTANGYSAVRGTKWIVAFQQLLMSVYVLNGTVEMGSNGATPPAMVNGGQWGSIDATGNATPPQPTTPQMLQPVLDATSDTVTNTVPSTLPTQPLLPQPVLPVPTLPVKPKTPRAEKGDKMGGHDQGKDHDY